MSTADTSVFVLFGLYGEFDPDVVTAQLRITPTSSFVQGEPVGGVRTGRVHEQSGWVVTTDERLGVTIDPHLAWLLERLEPVASELAAFRSLGVQPRVDCTWSSVGRGGGPWVTTDKLRRLVDLDLDLIISFYAVD